MKMKPLMAMALVSCTTAVFAADDRPYFGLQGSYISPDLDRQTDQGLGATLLLGLPAGDYLASELNVFGLKTDRLSSTDSEQLWGAGLDLAVYPFKRSASFSPFLLLGSGMQYDDRASNDGWHGFLNAGGGVLYTVNQRTSLRLDAKRYRVNDNEVAAGNAHLWDTRINAGVQIAFGGDTPPPVIAAPPPPAPPADSDGDGVPDSRDRCPNTPLGSVVDANGCPPPPPPPPAPKDSDQDGVLDPVDACPGTPYGMKVDASGCAIKTAKVVLHDINFEFDSARLTAAAKQSLSKVAEGLRGQPSMELLIEGHTDSVGADAYNLKLSKLRANAARDYLIGEGISPKRLTAEGLGEAKPVASNKTKDGRAENRRVEFSVTKQ
ncbi:OmpA family protein [Stagnimonas aquatica]|nr:OmpA family protein [Stagnimonas aquatica]